MQRQRIVFDKQWSFHLGDDRRASRPDYDDAEWRRVDVPHDWSIEGEYSADNSVQRWGAYLPGGVGWYRKGFEWAEPLPGRQLYLEFDGIYMNSDVWINGHHVGNRPYGYVGFYYDITPFVVQGTNVVAVRVDCSKAPSSRWYTGAGIYRHVWLHVADEVLVAPWGTYVTTPEVSAAEAVISVATEITNNSERERAVTIEWQALDAAGVEEGGRRELVRMAARSRCTVEQSFPIASPKLWSPDFPQLYTLTSVIMEDGQLLDETKVVFGIRYTEFNAETGFSLNGVPMKLQGVCLHHDAGPVGAAVPDKLLEKRLKLLKEMGCNAIRASHNPMAAEFYDLCDSLGILVMDEAFDGWDTAKVEYDYHIYFNEWWQRDLSAMVLRDRNHPSVILWSLGNEVRKINAETTRELVEFVHRLDPTRPVTCGVNMVGPAPDAIRSLLDVAGYNDGGGACFIYEADHRVHPTRVMVATEAPHTAQTRGFYKTQTWWRDKDQPRIEIPNLTEEEIFFDGPLHYHSSYDNSGVRASARHSWGFVKKYPYLIGEFRWSGFDYLGETGKFPARSNNAGVIDLANFPKDHYYFYQSQFTSKPMIHLLPHWTHPGMEGVVIPVWVYTNCQEAELFLNGCSLGRQIMGEQMVLSWDVPYEAGALKAIGYNGDRSEAEKQFETAGPPATVRLSKDVAELQANGEDISQVTFEIVDSAGRFVPYGNNRIHLIASGPVQFLGSENGDIVDVTPAKSESRHAFFGLGMGLYRSTFEEGNIEVLGAGIIGERLFRDTTAVSVSVDRISLRGPLSVKRYDIFYTTDGTEPDRSSSPYAQPLTLCESRTVRAALYDGEQLVVLLETEFVQGEKEKFVDLTHTNKPYNPDERFPGPYADELSGMWECGGARFLFMDNGELYRFEGAIGQKLAGYWWYNFPADPLETPNYAGTGQIRWNDGRLQSMALATQEGRRLHVSSDGNTEYWVRR
jgi:beta-galactosidase